MITIYADGSALGTPGPGGWAFLVHNEDGTKVSRCGAVRDSTNNQMELTAAINGLAFVPTHSVGVIRCDSQYVVKGVNEWRKGWERKGMRKSNGDPVLNVDLWRKLFEQVDAHPGIRFEWVKGHATDQGNNDVDLLARTVAENLRDNPPPFGQPLGTEKVTYYPETLVTSFKMMDPAIEAAIAVLQDDMAKLRLLNETETTILQDVQRVLGDGPEAVLWLLRYNRSLGDTPIERVLRGETQVVSRLLAQIEHGVYV